MQLIIQINLYCLIPDSHKKTKTNNNRIAMKKFQRFCTLFLLMIGLCSFALHAQSYAGLWRQVEQAQKEEFAANGSEADGENLPESRVGEKCSANAQGIYLSGGLSGKTDSG